MTSFNSWSEVAARIEHTAVGPTVTTTEARRLANEVNVYDFYAAVVTPYHVETVHDSLEGDARLVTVIGYPYGIEPTPAKVAEFDAVAEMVDEIDLVMNRIAFADGDFDVVKHDIHTLRETVDALTLKVIIETPVLSDHEIKEAASLAVEAGADVVKTAVGYDGPAAARHVALIRDTVGDDIGVKASGGIRTYADVLEMIEAGADQIGTSSGIEIHSSAKQHLE